MKYLLAILLAVSAHAECKVVPNCSNYRSGNCILWKPVAEHQDKPVVVTWPVGAFTKVDVLDKDKHQILNMPKWSSGGLGDVWRTWFRSAEQLKKQYGSIYVKVKHKGKCELYFQKDPCKRSDGNMSVPGNCPQ